MGITITANNSKYEFDMGYGSFRNLRVHIAKAYNEKFGELYASLAYCHSEADFKKHDEIANWMIEYYSLSEDDIIDFLYQSDCEGKISYRTCGKIYRLIKDIDFENARLVYVGTSSGNDYEEFKAFLEECHSKRRNMFWK